MKPLSPLACHVMSEEGCSIGCWEGISVSRRRVRRLMRKLGLGEYPSSRHLLDRSDRQVRDHSDRGQAGPARARVWPGDRAPAAAFARAHRVWGMFVGTVDNFIKPWLIGFSIEMPMSLTILGVFGGFLAFGYLVCSSGRL